MAHYIIRLVVDLMIPMVYSRLGAIVGYYGAILVSVGQSLDLYLSRY